MKEIGRKTDCKIIIYVEFAAGILCLLLAAAVTALLIWYAVNDGFAGVDKTIAAIVFVVFYLLCLGGGGWLIERFCKWKKLPETLIWEDGDCLCFYTNKEERIAWKDVDFVFAGPESLFVHLLGGGYGIVYIKADGKKYKVYFVDEANTIPDAIADKLSA